MSATAETPVIRAMREWASAIRGDWSYIDGRSVKAEVEGWVSVLTGEEPDRTIERWRDSLGLCPQGGGHWTEHCCEARGCERGESR